MIPFVVTGIPRSGTSIMSKLICEHVPNAYCLNEVIYRMALVKHDLLNIGEILLETGEAPNKYYDGGLVYNVHENERMEWRKVEKEFDEDLLIGSKVTSPYLMYIEGLMAQNLPILGMIRDPLYTIASWLSPQSATMAVAQVTPDNLSYRWENIDFKTEDRYSRSAELWNYLAEKVMKLTLFKYEELSGERRSCGWWDGIISYIPKIDNFNLKDRYDVDWGKIEEAVEAYAPLRKEFGY